MKRVAIVQSNYIPWKGYFDIVRQVDLFLFHDDLQYTKNDWRNRNKIKTPHGLHWLTIPCGTSEKRLICEVELKNDSWQEKHWRQIEANYRRAAYFDRYREFFRDVYLGRKWQNLSELNQFLIKKISTEFLGIKDTEFDDSRRYDLKCKKSQRVLELLRKVGAGAYLSGPAAKGYLDPDAFRQADIELAWMDYSGYPEYEQMYPPFEHGVSIVDLLFSVGEEAPSYMKSFG